VKGETAIYLDTKKVASEEFEDAVEKELKKHSQSLTCVVADRAVAWSQVTSAIDAAKKQGADVVLLTATPRRPVRAYTPAPSISSSLSLRSTPQR
jgi:biopolymer transport protein ExbD